MLKLLLIRLSAPSYEPKKETPKLSQSGHPGSYSEA